MSNVAMMQGVYVSVPVADWKFFKELVRKMGWRAETREELLDAFIDTRPADAELSDEEIVDEVKAVRYGNEDNSRL